MKFIKDPLSYLNNLVRDAFRTATSKEKLFALLKVPLYSNSLYLMMNAGATAILGFVFWLVVARFYSAEDVGMASAAISAIQLLSMLALLGLNFSLIRYLKEAKEKSVDLINSSFTLCGLASVAAAVIFILGINIWSPALITIQQNGVYFAGFIIFTIVATMLALLNNIFIAGRRSSIVLSQNMVFSLLKIGLAILLAAYFTYFGILASWGLSVTVVVFIFAVLVLPRVHAGYYPAIKIDRQIIKKVFHFSFLSYLSELFWNATTFILPLMVVNILGAEQNAYFYITWSVGGILVALSRSVSLALLAEGSHDENKLMPNVNRSLKITTVLLLPAILLILLVGDKILLLFGQSYPQNGTELLWLVAVSALPVSVNFIYLSVRRVEKKLKGVVILTAFVMITTLVLSYILLPVLGLVGVGVSWLSAHGAAAAVIIFNWVRRRRSLI